jgi:5-methylcytosine-specific restriction endonuclease McrA
VKRVPLVRRTPMPRSGVSLRARSPKTARVYVQRRALVAALLAERPVCELRWDAGCTGRAVDVDERLSRAQGGSILDPANCQTTCRHCHTRKHAEPAEAVRRGLTVMRRAS